MAFTSFEEIGIRAVVKDHADYMHKLDQMEKKTGGLGSFLGGALKVGAIGSGLALAGVASAVAFAGIGFNNMRQQAEVAFTTMLGNGEKARAFLDDLQSFAATTPFEFPDLVQASQKLLAMGFSAEEVRPTLTAIGDAVAGLGGGSAQIDQVTRALGQMKAKGKASAEEMLQLTEAGIPAWQMLADAIGTDVRGAMEKVSKGAVDSDTVISAMVTGMNNKFGGLMEKQSHTFGGLLSTLKDTFTILSGSVMAPFFEMAVGGMDKLVKLTGSEGFTNAIAGFSKGMETGMGKVSGFFREATGEAGFLNQFATKLALALGVPRGSEKLIGFGSTVMAIFQQVGGVIGDVFREVWGVFQENFLPILQRIGTLITDSVLPALLAIVMGPGRAFVQLLFEIGREAAPVVAAMLSAILEIFEAYYPALSKVIQNVSSFVASLLDWVRESGLVHTAMVGVKTIVEALSPVLEMLGKVAGEVAVFLTEHKAALLAVAIAAGILLVVLNPIPAAIIGIILAIGYLRENWDEITAAVTNFIDRVKEIPVLGEILERTFRIVRGQIEDIVAYVRSIIEVGREVISFFQNIFQGDWEAAWQDIKDIAEGVLDLFLNFLRLGFIDDIIEVFSDLPAKIGRALGNLGELLLQKGRELLAGLLRGISTYWDDTLRLFWVDLPRMTLEALGDLARTLQQKGTDLIKGLWNGAVLWSDEHFEPWLRALPGRTVSFLGDTARLLWQKGIDLIKGLLDGAINKSLEALEWVGGLPQAIIQELGYLPNLLWDAGLKILQGFLDGMKDKWEDIKGWVGGIPGKIKDLKGPDDPVLLVESGQKIMMGLLDGLKMGWAPAEGWLAGRGPSLVAAFSGLVQSATAPAGAAGRSIGTLIRDGIDIILKNLGASGGLREVLKDTRDFINGLHSELNRLLGLPTAESAEEQLRLAELNLERFQLEERAAAERATREQQLGDMRAQLATEEAARQNILTQLEAAREAQDQVAIDTLQNLLAEQEHHIGQLQSEIDTTEAARGAAEQRVASIEDEIDAIRRMAEQRRLEREVLEARGLAADQTLLTDQEMKEAAEAWIKQIQASTDSLNKQTGDIWTQYLPALKAIEDQQRALAAAAEDARRRETQAAIDAINAQIAAAQKLAEWQAAQAQGPLAEIGVGMQGEDIRARLARVLQSMGTVGGVGNVLEVFLREAATRGGDPISTLRDLFGPGGPLARQVGQLENLLMSEGIQVGADWMLIDLVDQAAKLAGTLNQTAADSIQAVSASVQSAVAPITGAVGEIISTGTGFFNNKIAAEWEALATRQAAEDKAITDRILLQQLATDEMTKKQDMATNRFLAVLGAFTEVVQKAVSMVSASIARAMAAIPPPSVAPISGTPAPPGGVLRPPMTTKPSSLAPSPMAALGSILVSSPVTNNFNNTVTAGAGLSTLANRIRILNYEMAGLLAQKGLS